MPSDAAKRKACELANAQGHAFMLDRVGRYFPEPKPGFLRENAAVYALALHLDEVDRVARNIARKIRLGDMFADDEDLRSLMLHDEPDALQQIGIDLSLADYTIDAIRAELEKRGLAIVEATPPG